MDHAHSSNNTTLEPLLLLLLLLLMLLIMAGASVLLSTHRYEAVRAAPAMSILGVWVVMQAGISLHDAWGACE